MTRRRWVLGALIVAGATLAWWLGDIAEKVPLGPQPGPAAGRVTDYYFADFRISRFDAGGSLSHRLEGRRLAHFRDDGSSRIEAPQLRFAPAGAPPWTVQADSGWLSADASELRLLGAVTLVRDAFAEAAPLHIATRDLTILPDDHYATTDQPVMLRSPGLRVDAVGMTTQFDSGQLTLLSQVKGEYVKTQP